jgi:phage terminase large subunit-like protein
VASGRIIAGPYVRAACARHLRDLEHGAARGLVWKPDLAARVFRYFATVLHLNGGDHEGQPFHLHESQQFIVGSLFGWTRADGARRFRLAFIEEGKGSGKSPLAAGIGLYMLMSDGEARAEVYAAAVDKDQAGILFRDAVAMVRQSPAIDARITFSGGMGREYNIAYLSTGSFFRPVSSESSGRGKSGFRPHCVLLDEIHEHPTNAMVEFLSAGVKNKRQPLIFMITNSGVDRASVCFEYHQYGAKVAAGDIEDDTFFSYICACDEGDDPFTDEPDAELGYPRSWAKVNPLLGVTIAPSYLSKQVREAQGMPSKESIVRRLNFCQWVDAENPWIDGDLWRACERSELTLPTAGGSLGLDLSGKRDLTAAARVVLASDGVLEAEVRFWTPADTLQERAAKDRVPYDAWVRDGHLIAVPGRSIDYAFVARDLADWLQAAAAMAFDPYRLEDFQRELGDAGIESWVYEGPDKPAGQGLRLVRHGQGFRGGMSDSPLWMPRSISDLETAVLAGKLRVRRNPVLTWASASAVLEMDASANKKWEKRKSTGRIDGIVALCMAVGLAMVAEPETPEPSIRFI